jgi:hypothetical protein
MAGQVATRQLGQGRVAVDGRQRAEPVAHQREGMVTPDDRAAHDQRAQ